tara:strand:- start:7158 stop:7304 length:147 start_codon:yes stop_codon:yes gene_type:complete
MSAEKTVGKVLLVGPSSDIKTFSKDFLKQKKIEIKFFGRKSVFESLIT